MKGFATILALAGVAAAASSTAELSPTGTTPASCATNYADKFEISVVNASTVSKRALQRRTALVLTLEDSVLHDAEGRIGYIASNNQFQFDFGGQAGAIYTAGWSVCSNGTLALGSSAIFYECLSGTFYNLYDKSEGAQCSEIFIDIVDLDVAATASGTSAAATAAGVTQISDGQVQATTAVVSQISDGQIQATTATAAVVSQISDGQIQAATSTAAVVSQISDGQIQAATSTAAVVSQISDGQIQAATSTKAATSSKVAVVSQISDGQIQATSAGVSSVISASSNGTGVATASPTTTAYTGAAALPNVASGVFGVAAGVLALAML